MTDNNEVTSMLEDLLFQRRLQRNLNSELERLTCWWSKFAFSESAKP